MKREARLLLLKAKDALVLAIEIFNRPYNRGRVSATLILLDHAFEMLLKAAIIERGGRIREKGANQTIGFDACVRRALTDGRIKFLDEQQALTLQATNGLRDAAQHYLLEISEGQLYMHAQAGLTLFRDIFEGVFATPLCGELPARVIPLATQPPTDLETLFDSETAEVQKLLGPNCRRRTEADARLRPLAILDATIRGEKTQPGSRELTNIKRGLSAGKTWQEVFPGVAALNLTSEVVGPTFSLRFTKKTGLPIHVVPEGTPGAFVVGVKRVDELSYYSLGRDELARKLGLSGPKTTACIRYLDLQSKPDCFKQITVGQSKFKRYSQLALCQIRDALKTVSVDDIWRSIGPELSRRKPKLRKGNNSAA